MKLLKFVGIILLSPIWLIIILIGMFIGGTVIITDMILEYKKNKI